MERWVLYAFISMCLAGFTSVVAKHGLVGILAELGLTVRLMLGALPNVSGLFVIAKK